MNTGLIAVIVVMTLTAIVLVAGLVVMVRGGGVNKKYSNKLMWMRIVFQAVALGGFAILLYATQ